MNAFTRRELLAALALGSFVRSPSLAASASAEPSFPGTPFSAYWKCLPDYLTALAARSVEKRNADLALLTSATAIARRQEWVAEQLWNLIGGQPERTPLNAKLTGTVDLGDLEVQKFIYETRPKLYVPANVYLPKTHQGNLPAVLFQSGHYWEGKAYPSYQRFCQGLARQGYAVLAFEPMGQGERIYYRNAEGRSRLPSCDAEHTVPGKQMILFGDTCVRFQLWDAVRSLDFLLSLPMVDSKRIGATGHSGGGTLTMLLCGVDQRVAAAAVCMGNLENIAALPFGPPGSTDDAEQNLIGGGPLGLDRWDLLHPFAPKPLMVLPSDRDFFATYSPLYIRNAWQEFHKLKSVYRVLGKTDHLQWADTPLPHALAHDSRLLIYRFFTRWLQPGNQLPEAESPVDPQPVERLWATAAGSTLELPDAATPFTINRSHASGKQNTRLEDLLQIGPQQPVPVLKQIGSTRSGTVKVEVLEITSNPGVRLPAWLIVPEQVDDDAPVILSLDPQGAEALWFGPEVDRIVPRRAPLICAADVRGVGSLIPQTSSGPADYEQWHQQEENYAWASLVFGKPLLGQRVLDILCLVRALNRYPRSANRPIRLCASGKLTVPALLAAAIEKSIHETYLSGGLGSFRSIVDAEVFNHPFANFVPGFLNHTDLPEIAASVAPRKVYLAGTVDANNEPMTFEAVQSLYAAAVRAGVVLMPSAAWSVNAILDPHLGETASSAIR